jgi:methylated-DNA-[protein]-cysteine S-methyltransferase
VGFPLKKDSIMASPAPGLTCSIDNSTPIGIVEVYATQAGVFQVNLKGRLASAAEPTHGLPESDLSRQALMQIAEYLAHERREFDVILDFSAVRAFQRLALEAARRIPFGKVVTYGELANQMGNSSASRAIGGAMGHNPIPILIPCHRVVAADGRLTGYSAADGIRTKQWLLELEGHRIVREKLA